jgi:glycosyltransferase involved in cell wall biosynthesis
MFAGGNRQRFRRRFRIDDKATVVGHVGRLAAEKNLDYLARAVASFLATRPDTLLLVVGAGESGEAIEREVLAMAAPHQLAMAGRQTGQDLADAYAAMDVFAFSSQSETQGMVLAEAMAAGVPAIALDGPGVREIVNESNGRLLAGDAAEAEFAAALGDVTADRESLNQLAEAARRSAREFSIEKCADRVLQVYERLVRDFAPERESDPGPWDRLLGRLEIEWNLLVEKTSALVAAARDETPKTQLE